MRFRKKNLDYEILKAVSERKPKLLRPGANSVSIMSLTQKLFPETKSQKNKTLLDKKYEEMKGRVNALAKDELLIAADGIFIESIKPEGRALLDRLENNRWQTRFADWIMGIIAGLILAAFIKYLGLN